MSARRAAAALRVALLDIDALVRDMLTSPSRRELGPAQHRRLYREAHDTAMAIVTSMEAEEQEADPAGSGGSPCE